MTSETKKLLHGLAALIWIFSFPLTADDQIPAKLQGTWQLDIEATTAAIESDRTLPTEMANGWSQQKDAIIAYDRIITSNEIVTSMRIKGRDERVGAF